MAVLRTPITADAYADSLRARDGVPNGVPTGTRKNSRVRSALAMLVYSAGYPLLAAALWMGARNGNWFRASVFVALGVFMSFVGWALLGAASTAHSDEPAGGREGDQGASVYLALYNRAGALIVLLGSYAIAATAQGWPTPRTFIGWFALVWVPLFVSFAIPVNCSSGPGDADV